MTTAVHALADPRLASILKAVALEHATHRTQPVGLVLDYDGTLAPIVADPAAAVMVPGLVPVLRAATSGPAVAAGLKVVVVSGRSVAKVRAFLAPLGPASLAAIRIAGSHGYDIQPAAAEEGGAAFTAFPGHAPLLRRACALLESKLTASPIPGATVEDNVFSVSLHYRNTPAEHHAAVQRLAEAVNAEVNTGGGPTLEVRPGKAVWELRPAVAWGKGHALRHLVESGFFGEDGAVKPVLPVLIVAGDDATDEDMFRAALDMEGEGKCTAVPIVVCEPLSRLPLAQHLAEHVEGHTHTAKLPRVSAAKWYLTSPPEVRDFVAHVTAVILEEDAEKITRHDSGDVHPHVPEPRAGEGWPAGEVGGDT